MDFPVLATREINRYDDSDFTALLWLGDRAEWRTYGSTAWAGWTHPAVDATEDDRQAYGRWASGLVQASRDRRAVASRAIPQTGDDVTVVGTRKHLGKTGRVTWRGANRFRTYYRNGYSQPEDLANQTVRIEPTDGSAPFFTDLLNVRVQGYETADLHEMDAILRVDHGPIIPGALMAYVK